ncbi:MAG: hypothetical protein AAFR66_24125, partial [Bacteroidota bacterium]
MDKYPSDILERLKEIRGKITKNEFQEAISRLEEISPSNELTALKGRLSELESEEDYGTIKRE